MSDYLKVSVKKYRFLLAQVLALDPVVTILENTLGPVVLTRVSNGYYRATLAGAFPKGKVAHIAEADAYTNPGELLTSGRESDDVMCLKNIFVDGGTPQDIDNLLAEAYVEFRVYP